MAQVGQFLLHTAGPDVDQIDLVAPSCVVDLGAGLPAFALRDVAGSLRMTEGGTVVTASYRVENGAAAPRCELKLTRERRNEAVRTVLALKTMDSVPLPAQVLDVFFNSSDWLGARARVEGELTLRQTGAGDWDADFQGNIQDLDLAALLGHIAPRHRLTGRARLDLQQARWADQAGRGPGWVEARGRLTGGSGTISTRLLQALQGQMRFRLAERLSLTRPEFEFQALGLSFELNRAGEIRFDGGLGPEYLPGAILRKASGSCRSSPRPRAPRPSPA